MLLDNALSHGDGEVRIDLHEGADAVTITVSDEGPGFSASATTTSLATPTTSGLGLPLAQRLTEALPGRLVLRCTSRHPQIDIVLQRITGTTV